MCPRSGASKLLLLFIFATLIGGSFSLFSANVVVKEKTTPASFTRPSIEKIRSETRSILENPKFAPRKSLGQWLFERLQDWEIDMPEGLSLVGKGLYWIIVIGCVLTVLFFLGYLIYNITMAIKERASKAPISEIYSGELVDVTKLSYEELRARMQDCARKRDYKNAIRYMMLALLRWLDANRILSFHESKTNGDYLREFAPMTTGVEPFRQFVKRFDYSIYGGFVLDNANYDGMSELYDKVCKDVGAKI